jgi:broad specificity phosphatase PhoE
MLGGKDNIFNLSQEFKFTNDVQQNLEILHQKYGDQFQIKHNDNILDVTLEKITYDANNVTFWCLHTKEEYKTNLMYHFCINFYDIRDLSLGNISYISNVSRTDKMSGTETVKLVLEINKKLGVQKTFLHDGATIECKGKEYDLSYFKLIEKKKTFYMKLGFKLELNKNAMPMVRFNTIQDLENKIDELVEQIRKIKIQDIIEEYEETLELLHRIIKENNKKEIDIILGYKILNSDLNFYHKKNPYENIQELILECHDMLKLLEKTEEKYLYKYMIEIFNNKEKCSDYELLEKYIFYSERYKIIYGDKEITRKYPSIFYYLAIIKAQTIFSYNFDFNNNNNKNNIKHLYFIRHGETQWNIEGKTQGSEADIPLNDTGKEQAKQTGKYLNHFRLSKDEIDAIWSSPLLRAKQTAEIIKDEIKFKNAILFDDELKEFGKGKMSGLKKDDELMIKINKKIDELFGEIKDPIEKRIRQKEIYQIIDDELEIGAEGESFEKRANSIINKIKNSSDKIIIIVSHSGFIAELISKMYHVPNELKGLGGKNSAISYHTYNGNNFTMISEPNDDHLRIDM